MNSFPFKWSVILPSLINFLSPQPAIQSDIVKNQLGCIDIYYKEICQIWNLSANALAVVYGTNPQKNRQMVIWQICLLTKHIHWFWTKSDQKWGTEELRNSEQLVLCYSSKGCGFDSYLCYLLFLNSSRGANWNNFLYCISKQSS